MTCVGLNTVPAWCRPFQCLSNGQQERVLLAVALCDGAVLDDFGAVLDDASARGAAASLRKRVEVPRNAERRVTSKTLRRSTFLK